MAGCKPEDYVWWSNMRIARRRVRRLPEPLMVMEIGRNTSGFLLEQWLCSPSRASWRLGLATSFEVPPTFQGQDSPRCLPFENLSRDPDQEFFSDGLTEEMIAQVGKLNRDRLTVVASSSVAKYKGSNLAAKEIGRELNADYLVQGSVRRGSDRVRVTVQLVQAQNQTDLWTESYDRELKDLLAVQDSVVQSIASQIHIALSDEQKTRFASPRQSRPEAYEAYLKGRYYWNKRTADSMQKAEHYFQQAIDNDPTYAAAYSGLADCNSGLDVARV